MERDLTADLEKKLDKYRLMGIICEEYLNRPADKQHGLHNDVIEKIADAVIKYMKE
jgi:hypothetical protein